MSKILEEGKTMSEILKKKSVKIAVAIICLAVLAIIAGFVV